MTTQQYAILFYILSMSLAAPMLWFTYGPTIATLIHHNNGEDYVKALALTAVMIWSVRVWYTTILVPVVRYTSTASPFGAWDWILAIALWPTAITTTIFLYKEWKRIKASKRSVD